MSDNAVSDANKSKSHSLLSAEDASNPYLDETLLASPAAKNKLPCQTSFTSDQNFSSSSAISRDSPYTSIAPIDTLQTNTTGVTLSKPLFSDARPARESTLRSHQTVPNVFHASSAASAASGASGVSEASRATRTQSMRQALGKSRTPVADRVIQLGKKTVPEFRAPSRFLGESTYRETGVFILAAAVYRVFPNSSLVVDSHVSLESSRRSYWCRIITPTRSKRNSNKCVNRCDTMPLTPQVILKLKREMKRIVSMQLKIEETFVPYEECLQILDQTNQSYSHKLIDTLNAPSFKMCRMVFPPQPQRSAEELKRLTARKKMLSSMAKTASREELSSMSSFVPVPDEKESVKQDTENTPKRFDSSPPRVDRKGSQDDIEINVSLHVIQKLDTLNTQMTDIAEDLDATDCKQQSGDEKKPQQEEKQKQEQKQKKKDETHLATTEFCALSHRKLLYNSGFCPYFELFYESAKHFVLSFPSKNDTLVAKECIPKPKFANCIKQLYEQGETLGEILGLECVGDLNDMIQKGRWKEMILLSEAFHDKQIVDLCAQIRRVSDERRIRIICISGPSSSGKTTFASKLALQLRLCGLKPVSLEIDNYYRHNQDPDYPLDSQGQPNFETIEALRLDYLNQSLLRLLRGETISVPKFDFVHGRYVDHAGGTLSLDPQQGVLIMEGIFCLNPKLTAMIDDSNKFKIFICPLSFLSLDNCHFLSEQLVRVVRRISRDHQHRGRGAEKTLFKWGTLRQGEDQNIFPFVAGADAVFNSSLIYEMNVMKVYSYPLLNTVKPGKNDQYKDAKNLESFLNAFLTMSDAMVPRDSLLMEFVGKSVFDE